MTAILSTSPFTLDFIKNELFFGITGTPVKSLGKKYETVYVVDHLPAVGEKLIIQFYNRTLEFTIKAASKQAANDAYAIQNLTGADLRAELTSKISNNYYLNLYYTVSSVVSDFSITFRSLSTGGEPVLMKSSTDDDFFSDPTNYIGYPKNEIDNYRIYAKFLIDRYKDEISESIQTPELFLSLDSKYKAKVPVDLLRSYFENVDIPQISVNAFTKEILKYAFLKVRLQYAEFFDSKVQMVKNSGYHYFLNAACISSHRSVNKQEWVDPISSDPISKSKRLRIFGTNQDSVRTFPGMQEYIYVYYFDQDQISTATRLCLLSVTTRLKDGTTSAKQLTFEVKNHNFVRINCSVNSLQLSDPENILDYTVYVADGADGSKAFLKTYRIFNKPIQSNVFLLQNRYGVLEGFYSESQKFEKSSSGEKLIMGSLTSYDLESEYKFTASTGFKSENQLQLLSDASENRFNFIVINNTAVPISIIPGSIVVRDKKEDLLSAEFEYTINTSKADKTILVDYFKQIAYVSGVLADSTVINEQDIVNINDRVNNL